MLEASAEPGVAAPWADKQGSALSSVKVQEQRHVIPVPTRAVLAKVTRRFATSSLSLRGSRRRSPRRVNSFYLNANELSPALPLAPFESHDSPPRLLGVPLLLLAQRRLRQGSSCHLKQWGGKGLKKKKKKKPTQIQALYDGRKDLFLPCLPPKKTFPKSYRIKKYIWYVDGSRSVLINLNEEVFRLVGFHHISSHYSGVMI